jgi:hypothetical protein
VKEKEWCTKCDTQECTMSETEMTDNRDAKWVIQIDWYTIISDTQ